MRCDSDHRARRHRSDSMQARPFLQAVLLAFTILLAGVGQAAAQNAIVTENQLPGNDSSEWDVTGKGDPSIQGFATAISVNKGETVRFKINSDAASYHVDLYRLGYYGGQGARRVGSGVVTATLPQTQPAPLSDAATGLVDCGNWSESAHWDVPASAVSGIYLARLVRADTQGASHIVFIVRDDSSHSAVLFKTADATWQAYNVYGGNSLYLGTTSFPAGHAVKVSYNRPFWTRSGGGGSTSGEDWLFNSEVPMLRWLEANGYDVSYSTDVDTDRRGLLIARHQVFMAVGHDEYWSATARANVTSARDAGVHLAFFDGNEMYWKTRFEASIDGSGTSYRTLVCYKEGTLGENVCGGKCDPVVNSWTGLWRDGCGFTGTADGCRPENSLTGQMSWDGTVGAIQVPDGYRNLRFWRHTNISTLGTGQVATLSPNSLGYEWDYEQHPESLPAGRIELSSTTLNGKIHRLSLYRAASGALVFGAGTVQWSWGLDSHHDGLASATSPAMQQATLNLLADMGVQPGSIQAGLTATPGTTDVTAPVSVITSPVNGSSITKGLPISVSGSATDADGAVAGVEVSINGGATWHRATGTASWTYDWTPTANGVVTIKSRAFDDSGNMESTTQSSRPNVVSNEVMQPKSVTEGPGGPILVITTAANPFSQYYAEILRAEGFNAFSTMDLSLVDATVLNNYDVVILGEMSLSASQVTLLGSWTNAGGVLVAMKPDGQLSSLLGLTPAGGTLANTYLLVNTASGPGVGIVNETMQYHGIADRYSLNGATSVATLYTDANTATTNPAVSMRTVGASGGQAIAWTYDLARSIVYTRQGNPAWVGQKRDGQIEPIRSDDLFFGAASGDPQADWVDLGKVAIPQADEQQRLLANVITKGMLHRKPMPRFWYLPKGLKAAVVMTGDNHTDLGMQPRFDIYRNQSPAECSPDDWECVRATGYMYVGTSFTDAQAQFYNSLGFEVSLHVNSGCARTTPAEYDAYVTSQVANFVSVLPGLPAPLTNRNHCIAWSDWSSVAEVESAHGIRLDTSYYYWPSSWVQNRPGMFTGSGFPMRFAKLDGSMIDCYQAATQMTDEAGQSYPQFCDVLLDRAIGAEGYYGVFTTNMHFDVSPELMSDQIVASAQARGVPVISAKQLLAWTDGRNGSSFNNLVWSSNALSFSIAVAAGSRNMRGMVPVLSGIGPLGTLTRNGSPVSVTTQTIKGIDYAFFPADAGNYVATYIADVTPPAISNVQVSPNIGGTATVTWTTDESSTSRVDYGTAAGSLALNTGNVTMSTSHSITLSGLSTSTTYYFRVTSADASLNSATVTPAPQAPLSFTTPSPSCFLDDLATDFAAGSTGGSTTVTLASNGEVILKPAASAEFSTLPPVGEWDDFPWNVGGTGTVSNGQLVVDGSRMNSEPAGVTYGPGSSLEFVATFAAVPYQAIGLGAGNDNAPDVIFDLLPFMSFSSNGTGMITRVLPTPSGTLIDYPLPMSLLGAPHRYRIDWKAASIDFSVDGALVHSENVTIADPMRAAISDYALGGSALLVDWIHVTPVAASGTFTSRVFDAGVATQWSVMLWTANVPAGASLAMSWRAGNTPSPDGSWTSFAPVAVSGGSASVMARYIQYQAALSTTDNRQTAQLQAVAMTCCSNAEPPAAMTNVTAVRQLVDSNADGTRQVLVTFTPPSGAISLEVYRARFGNYPYYDDAPNAGSAPVAPSYPPNPAVWTLTGITASGQTDEVAQRDEYTYAAFAKDGCGNVSAVSNLAGGVLNYVLGDVHDGQPGHECTGNNIVYIEDISYLGAHYGVTLGASDPLGCLDVGPTVTGAVTSRPLTDGLLNFEDLMMMALNFSPSPVALTATRGTPLSQRIQSQAISQDRLWIETPQAVQTGEVFTVRMQMNGSGTVTGVTAQLAWDASVAQPVSVEAGDLAQTQNTMVMSAKAGNVDAARLGGAGISGIGTLADVRFRAIAAGNPAVRLASSVGRDAANQNVTFAQPLAVGSQAAPLRTELGFAAPNPFRSRLGVQLAIAHTQNVRLTVYDLAGRSVKTLVEGEQVPGNRTVIWDGLDANGHFAAAGVYLLKLDTADIQQTRRVQLVR